ncbi:hypothetical protein [Rhodospirillum sp. A1_3_36]|uniref:hypothetical protein n=1 Tax=Rhodospirillum sp. A1_3_36 TaxID=3391666 RepID=UPI0039A51063
MNCHFSSQLDVLKAAITNLDATGFRGFEGLLAKIFSSITDKSFRLAGSGSQHGKDGSTNGSNDIISFEAKLYTGPINKNEVLSKLTEIIATDPAPDLWILSSTVEIKAQVADILVRAADKNGINLLILDWSPTATIPELAVVCALTRTETITFLTTELADPALVEKASEALLAIANHEKFDERAQAVLELVRNPSLAPSAAVKANREWLTKAFSNERTARREFGQVLAPLAKNALPTVERAALLQNVQQASYGSPTDRLVVLLGDEGCGKSWIFAQSWLANEHPPLTLLIPAAEVPEESTISNEDDFIIQQIIRQTHGATDQKTTARWRNILASWDSAEKPDQPNLVILLDGLNQRPGYDWPRWLDSMAYKLSRIGGQLVITTRNGYFNTRLRKALFTPQYLVCVEQWTERELEEILTKRNVIQKNLSQRVVATLRNPRVLGIAFELLEDGSIENFHELSVDRLLFEHTRKSARYQREVESPHTFSHRLLAHAREILQRVQAAQSSDALIFQSIDLGPRVSHQLSQDLLAVSEGRFFNALAEDPYLYELSDDGLVLALGFAILDTLGRAIRNGTDPEEALEVILGPITALDKTSEAVFAAMLISSIDERSKVSTTTALIVAYLRLQNLDEQTYPAFEAIIRNRIDAAMPALSDLATSPHRAVNDEWLTHALLEVRHDERCWVVMRQHIEQWLRCYSLEPSLRIFKEHTQDKEEYERKLSERNESIIKEISNLSKLEAHFLNTKMIRDDHLVSESLTSTSFRLLAGIPLSEFSEVFVAWAFSQAINSDFHRPYEEFLYLIRFNRVDWSRTREELLRHAAPFSQPEASSVGKWAFVHLLRAVSTIEDAEHCENLIEELTKDRESFGKWRRIETYCETDPCDPNSVSPENIKATAQKCREIDPGNICQSFGVTEEDQFLSEASFGLARFESETAIAVHRSIIEHASKNVRNSATYRLMNLRGCAPLVTVDARDSLLTFAREKRHPFKEGDKNSQNEWLQVQYAHLLTFPHMDGREQIGVLLSLRNFDPPLLDLADVIKPAPAQDLESALDRCQQSNDENFKMTILMFAQHSGSEISERSEDLLIRLTEDPNSVVRALAIGALVAHEKEAFIKSFSHGSWSASTLDPRKERMERWYGSMAIAHAFSKGFLSEVAAIDKISTEHYHMLASSMSDSGSSEIPMRLNASLRLMLAVDGPNDALVVEQRSDDHRKGYDVPTKSLVEPVRSMDLGEFFKRTSETEDEFDERQRQGWKAFDEFEAKLTELSAEQILEDTSRATLRVCMAREPNLVVTWAQNFLELPNHKIRSIFNFGLRVAEALSQLDPELSMKLFTHLRNNRGFVNIVQGPASLGLESLSIWNSANHETLNPLRAARLDEAKDDNEIAQEVLAAYSAHKEDFLDRYIEDKLTSERPVDLARALMVCGFSLENEKREAIIAAHTQMPGIIGLAAQSAKFAYERNVWAKHWHDLMHKARTPEEFWRFSVLFVKLVDGRYQCWSIELAEPETPMKNFIPSAWEGIKRRIKNWQDKRSKTLFGDQAPDPMFLDIQS